MKEVIKLIIRIPQIPNDKLYINNTNVAPELDSDLKIETGILITSNKTTNTIQARYILGGELNKLFIFINFGLIN